MFQKCSNISLIWWKEFILETELKMFVCIHVLHHQKNASDSMLLGFTLAPLPGAIMGAYKDKDKNMEGLMWLSGLSTNEAALKTCDNIKNSSTCICSQSLQFTRLDLRLPGELGEICLISETQQQPWGQKEGRVIPSALILRQFCI